jgi:hypothetical protein
LKGKALTGIQGLPARGIIDADRQKTMFQQFTLSIEEEFQIVDPQTLHHERINSKTALIAISSIRPNHSSPSQLDSIS